MKRRLLYLLMSAALVIPTYPGSKKMWTKTMFANGLDITILQYQSQDPADKIIDFYVDKLINDKWFLNHKDKEYPVIYLTGEDNSHLTVSCSDVFKRGITDIVIVHSTGITQEILQAMTMNTDYPGEDITVIPRYPGTIRKAYSKTDKFINLIYESKQGCLECVLRFYRSQMPALGWEIIKESKNNLRTVLEQKDMPQDLRDSIAQLPNAEMTTVSFKNKADRAMVTVSEANETITINIIYIKR